MSNIIYLEPDEEITKVIDRLRLSLAESVVFVVPRGSTLAQSIVNLKILKRKAEEQDKKIALVTNDHITRNIASQLNLTVYSKVAEAEKAEPAESHSPIISRREIAGDMTEKKESAGQIRVNSYTKYQEDETNNDEPEKEQILKPEIESEDEIERRAIDNIKAEPEETEQFRDHKIAEVQEMTPFNNRSKHHRNIQGSRKPFFLVLALIIIVIGLCSYIFIPTATATLTLKTTDYQDNLDVIIDKNIKTAGEKSLTVPGTLLQTEKEISKDFPASGKKDAGTKATGKITVQNNYDTNAHKYPKGSRFTSAGKTYLADDAFTVKAASISLVGGNPVVTPGEIEVAVTAENSGDSYNGPAATYTLEGAPAKITGRGGGMSGGLTKEIGVVLEEDLSAAEASLKKDSIDQAQKELANQAAAAGLKLADSSVNSELVSASSTKNANDEADTFTFMIKVKIYGLGFKEDDLKSAVLKAEEEKLGGDKMIVGQDKTAIDYTLGDYDQNQGQLKLAVSLKGKVGQKISESEIKNSIKNKSVNGAVAFLKSKDGIDEAVVKISPDFISLVPFKADRIKVKFDYSQ